MVDIHCHLLPAVDDGSRSWEMSVAMCRLAFADGVEHIVATPHANHEYAYDRARFQEMLERLRDMTGSTIGLSLGCDFHFSYENIHDALRTPDRYCIGRTRYLLVEFSDFAIAPTTGQHLLQLMEAGMTPILTHPERNPILARNPKLVLEWAARGTLVQVTANSLTGRWGPVAKKVAAWLMKNHACHVLASDAHDLKGRPPRLAAGRDEAEKIVGREAADAMVNANPRAIINGKPLPRFSASHS